ncbi:MAG: type IV pili methyl-accepting chemotaxis transducer N-terminal domain-containing protein [Magnetococcales bacterium]|nr:type IV pili methyl-accepting chemotaxis transducer N-terminal domain-containing protein [Magnetococcales bacterium]
MSNTTKNKKLRIRSSLLITNGSLIVLIFFILGVVYTQIENMSKDSITINLAGRQRMLSQRMTKEFLMFFEQSSKLNLDHLKTSVWVFDVTLDALKSGGKGPSNLDRNNPKFVAVGNPSAEVANQLDKVTAIWLPLKKSFDRLETGSAAPNDMKDLLLKNNIPLLKTMNKAVFMMSQESSSSLKNMLHTVIGSAVLAVLIGFIIVSNINALVRQFQSVIRQVFLQTRSMSACIRDLEKVKNGLNDDSMHTLHLSKEVSKDHVLVKELVSYIQQSTNETTSQAETISSATDDLSNNITIIASSSEQASANITTMASAAEEITANLSGVNRSLEQVDQSVGSIATAVKQVSASLDEVRKRCQTASKESKQANTKAQGTSKVMDELALSAKEIGQVIDIIRRIADQTNILALNASIEAAGAGEAGTGFAVVANEVKSLARQTNEAAKTISDKVGEIQNRTNEVSVVNKEITDSIALIDRSNANITISVDEQANSINEIADSINNVSTASGEVTNNAKELNLAAQDVAKSALEAAMGTQEMARSASEAAHSAEILSQQGREILATAQSVSKSAQEAATSTSNANDMVQEILTNTGYVSGAVHHASLLIDSMEIPGQKLQESVNIITLSPEPFDVEKVKMAHLGWLGKLEGVIRGRSELKSDQVASGHECEFGKWFDIEGNKKFGKMEIYSKVGKVHMSVHEVAKEAVKLVNEGNIAGAEEKMNLFSTIKDDLFNLLDQLYVEAAENR